MGVKLGRRIKLRPVKTLFLNCVDVGGAESSARSMASGRCINQCGVCVVQCTLLPSDAALVSHDMPVPSNKLLEV